MTADKEGGLGFGKILDFIRQDLRKMYLTAALWQLMLKIGLGEEQK